MKPVIEFLEYRDFLSHFYEERKKSDPLFSYRNMGKQLKIDPSYLAKVLKKERHINSDSIQNVIDLCGLQGTNAEYFTELVRFNKAKSDREMKQYYEHLLSLKGIKKYALEKNQYAFYQSWYNTAILTLLDFYPFSGDYKALAAKLSPPITENQAKKAISLLTVLNLIKKDGNGRYILTNNIITCGEQCRSIVVKTFWEETMRLALESIYRQDCEEKRYSTVTITILNEDLGTINEMIRTFRSSLLKFAETKKNADRVFQLNIQLFPLTV
jgi:uncharacterized protein (TIGR02147 family)